MTRDQEKIRRAAIATDVILEGCNAALQALQAPLWTNGAGVLSDPSMVRSNLHNARAAIDKALDAMKGGSGCLNSNCLAKSFGLRWNLRWNLCAISATEKERPPMGRNLERF